MQQQWYQLYIRKKEREDENADCTHGYVYGVYVYETLAHNGSMCELKREVVECERTEDRGILIHK